MELLFEFDQEQKGSMSLKGIVARQLSWLQPSAAKKYSLLVNDVQEDLTVDTNRNLLVNSLFSLMESVLQKTVQSTIRISVRRFGSIVMFRLTDSKGSYNSFDLNLHRLHSVAEQLGGCVMPNLNSEKANVKLSFRCNSVFQPQAIAGN